MNRPIKFRAWDKHDKRFIRQAEYAVALNGDVINFDSSGYDFIESIELMQYTGLKDKNGVEIYEGDIVEYKAYNTWHKDAVRFTDGKFHGNLSGFKEDLQSNYDLGLIVTLGCEVIGNIYENPDLLEAEL